jgi:hypothetical protein
VEDGMGKRAGIRENVIEAHWMLLWKDSNETHLKNPRKIKMGGDREGKKNQCSCECDEII